MKKLNKLLTVVFSFLLITLAFTTAANAEESKNKVYGKLKVELIFPTNLEDVEGTEEDKELLLSTGWKESLDGYVREYPLDNAKIVIDDKEYTTDSDGNFDIDLLKGKQYQMKIKHPAFEGQSIDIDTNKGDLYVEPEIKVNFMTFMEDPSEDVDNTSSEVADTSSANKMTTMASSGAHTGGFNGETVIKDGGHTDATYKKNSYVTCNRFNGSLGDQKYYNKAAHKVKSGVNFSWSDCDWAVGDSASPCLSPTKGDYASDPNKRYCKSFSISISASSRCSIDIGHKALYHKHTSSKGPSGY